MSKTVQPPQGLVVTITPSQSAFFAGELFSATITLSNPAPIVPPPSRSSTSNLAFNPPKTAVPSQRGAWRDSAISNQNSSRKRPPSASHIGLAEYATNHLDSDDVPESPYIGGGDNSGTFAPQASTSKISSLSGLSLVAPELDSASSSADVTRASTPFAPHNSAHRSVSGFGILAGQASSSQPVLPVRKGLVGKPLPPPEDRGPSGGLYDGGPRRPLVGKHGRSQSTAVSNPDLNRLNGNRGGAGEPLRGHGKGRLGGSLGGEALMSTDEHKRKPSLLGRASALAIDEEPEEPTSPSSPTSSSNSPNLTPGTSHPSLPTSETPNIKSPPPTSENAPSALSSTISSSDPNEYDPSDSNIPISVKRFYGLEENETMESIVRASVDDWNRRADINGSKSAGPASTSFPNPSGVGRSPYGVPPSSYPRNSFLYPVNSIQVFWSYAHLEGTFEVEDELIKSAEFIEVKKRLLGGVGAAVGGGTLEEPKPAMGWKEWLWGSGEEEEERKSAGASLEQRKLNALTEKTVPIFSSPPSILGVDLMLEPGESKSYTFNIRIPADLPPSFRGKAIRFSYHLVVGTNRTPAGTMTTVPSRGISHEARSRVLRVPVRVYNHVGISGARPFYDLTNPIIYHRDEASTSGLDDPKVKTHARKPSAGLQAFEHYAANLLDSVASANAAAAPGLATVRIPVADSMESDPSRRPEMLGRHAGGQDETLSSSVPDEEKIGCKAAVEMVSRNSQKVSYDINKDGCLVASLTLVKSSYRLGETVNGSILLNSGDGRVLRVSARLETHESIETSIATKPAAEIRELTRRLHSEHHETTLDSARVGFALAIPSGATPDFATSGVKLQWSVRLSFLVIPSSPDAPPRSPGTDEKVLFGSETGAGPNKHGRSPSTATAPSSSSSDSLGSHRHGRSKSFGYGFEPAISVTLPASPSVLSTGATHLMPVLGPLDHSALSTSYRAVPDLGFVPVLFSTVLEPPPSPGPLQRSASGTLHAPNSPSLGGASPGGGGLLTPGGGKNSWSPALSRQASVVLVPAKIETVECSIPIKVYPGNTPFRPTITTFDA